MVSLADDVSWIDDIHKHECRILFVDNIEIDSQHVEATFYFFYIGTTA